MPATSNTIACIQSFVGEKVKGILVGRQSVMGRSGYEEATTYTLIFKSGRGLTFMANPAGYMVWWEERKDDLRRALDRKADELRATGVELADEGGRWE